MSNRKQIVGGTDLSEEKQEAMRKKIDLVMSLAGSDPATMLTVISYALVLAAAKCRVTPTSVIAVLAAMFDNLETDDEDQDK